MGSLVCVFIALFCFLRITNLPCDVLSVVQQQLDKFRETEAGWVSVCCFFYLTFFNIYPHCWYYLSETNQIQAQHCPSNLQEAYNMFFTSCWTWTRYGSTVPYYKLGNNWRFNFFMNVKNGLPILHKLVLLWILQQNGKPVCLLPDIMQLLRWPCAVVCNSTLWLFCWLHWN